MQLQDFNYHLPPELIAQHPLPERASSRLLVMPAGLKPLRDLQFSDLPSLLNAGDLLIFNDTRVIPARLFGRKQTGGKIEILIERLIDTTKAWAHIRASKAAKVDAILILDSGINVRIVSRQGELFELQFEIENNLLEFLESHGHVPLPPYIEREDQVADKTRYQTVYAKQAGAVAAPTAGLHFDAQLLDQLSSAGIEQEFITLHVGAGTFQPVRVENIAEHQMHAERLNVSEQVCAKIIATKARGNKVIAVGTTVVRSLETAAATGEITPTLGDTQIFITPGYQFKCVDALITNFHLPCSTLLMLVSAFSGYDKIMQAYQHAIREKYRFFSYGDAMFLTREQC